MNTQAYIDISGRIRNLCPDIKDIDVYNHQYEDPELFETYQYPAVYVQWTENIWANNNDASQEGPGGFIIHVVTKLVEQGTRNIDLLDTGKQTASLAPFTTWQQVHGALNNWMPSGFITALERVGDEPEHQYNQIWIIKLKYTAVAIDYTTSNYNADNWGQQTLTDITPQGGIDDGDE